MFSSKRRKAYNTHYTTLGKILALCTRLSSEIGGNREGYLNYIEVMPSTSAPSLSESEKIVPAKVITRAQAKAAQKDRREKSKTPSESSKGTKVGLNEELGEYQKKRDKMKKQLLKR